MKRTKKQLNAISYSYREIREDYLRFLFAYAEENIDYMSVILMKYRVNKYKQLSKRIEEAEFCILLYAPLDLFDSLVGNYDKKLRLSYKKWKKDGEKF